MQTEIGQFNFQNPTKIIFGKNRFEELSTLIPKGKKVLITYGGGSVVRFGTLDKVKAVLSDYEVGEFGGIEANPTFETSMKAVEKIKAEGYDYLLAVGGGSVIDATKFIAAAAEFSGDPQNIFGGSVGTREPITKALPFGTILTLPATGSEMNSGAVISFVEKKVKLSFGSPFTFPQFSLLDPELTYTLPKRQLANGIIDSFVHIMEQYLTYPVGALVQDRYAESLLSILLEIGEATVDEENHDYNTRANFMWTATNALNGTLSPGVPGDWSSHALGHEMTALYHIDHARTLAVVLPAVMDIRRNEKHDKLVQYGRRVLGIQGTDEEKIIDQAIDQTKAFFESLGAPTSLSAYDLTASDVEDLIANLEKNGAVNISERGDQTLEISRNIYLAAL